MNLQAFVGSQIHSSLNLKGMEDNLVTLAIHTYEKAVILKSILESEGIEVYIHNVNLIQPVVSAGVRVRIKESDLPHALRVIEDNAWKEHPDPEPVSHEHPKKVLIPVDFSDYSKEACRWGIYYAHQVGAEVMLLHAYYNPYFPSAMPLGETLAYQINKEDSMAQLQAQVNQDLAAFCRELDQEMEEGGLPKVDYQTTLREGLPEEEILTFSEEYRPSLIVMGTRGKNQKELDLIGSVTAEVIEASHAPVWAIPDGVPFLDPISLRNVAFATSFNQRDLMAFDRFMEVMKPYPVNVHLFNISTSRNEWNEIRLSGVKEYFKKIYPNVQISYTVLADGDLLAAIEKFVSDQHIDMIALANPRRSLLARLFSPSKARRMLFHAAQPILVIGG